MSVTLENIPASEGVRKVAPGEGERFDVAGAHLTWKVKGEDSGYAFSICEQTLGPGEGVPLHSHSSPEVFYISVSALLPDRDITPITVKRLNLRFADNLAIDDD